MWLNGVHPEVHRCLMTTGFIKKSTACIMYTNNNKHILHRILSSTYDDMSSMTEWQIEVWCACKSNLIFLVWFLVVGRLSKCVALYQYDITWHKCLSSKQHNTKWQKKIFSHLIKYIIVIEGCFQKFAKIFSKIDVFHFVSFVFCYVVPSKRHNTEKSICWQKYYIKETLTMLKECTQWVSKNSVIMYVHQFYGK